MKSRMGQWIASIAVLATLASLVPGAPAARAAGPSPLEEALAGKYKGKRVSVGSIYGGQWYLDYEASLKSFGEKTGISVAQTNADVGSPFFAEVVKAGAEPDIVEFNIPGPLLEFARAGKVVDVSTFLDRDTLRARYDPHWLDWATMAGPSGPIVAGVWAGFNVDSLVWYPKAAFDKAGYQVPTTWQELLALSDRIVKDGGTPWCIDNGWQGSENAGETATHWISDLLLRTGPLADYDKWVRGELKSGSPQAKKAVQLMSDLWFKPGYAYGGRRELNHTYQWDAVKLLMDAPTKCWLMKEPNWITDYDGASPPMALDGKVYGQDYAFFVLPPVDPAYGAPVQVEGMLAAMFHDRPEVRAVMEYLTTGEQVHDWITRGLHARLSPHKAATLDWYTNPRERAVAEVARNASALRYWGPDAMPLAVDDQFSTSMAQYVDGKVDLDTALQQIDAAWPVAAPVASAAKPVRSVLFVGDSACFYLDRYLPKLTASADPPLQIEAAADASDGAPLANHWERPMAEERAIGAGKYDVVVLEEDLGDRWEEPGAVNRFVESARKFDAAIRKGGARTVLYMAWGDRGVNSPTTADIAAVYRQAGTDLGVKVAPVGLAFERALLQRPDLDVRVPGGDHQSKYGYYLALCVLYATIFDRNPVGLTYRMWGADGVDFMFNTDQSALQGTLMREIPEADAAFLQQVAWDAVTEYQAQK